MKQAILKQKWQFLTGLILSCAIAGAVFVNNRAQSATYQQTSALRQIQNMKTYVTGVYSDLAAVGAFLELSRRALPNFDVFRLRLPQSAALADRWIVAAVPRHGAEAAFTAWLREQVPGAGLSEVTAGDAIVIKSANAAPIAPGIKMDITPVLQHAEPGRMVVTDGRAFDPHGDGLWFASALSPPEDGTTDPGIGRYILLHKLELAALRDAANLDHDQAFNISIADSEGGGMLHAGTPLSGFAAPAEPLQLSLPPYRVVLTVDRPNITPLPQTWVLALIAGLGLTGLWVAWRAADLLVNRSQSLGRELDSAHEELHYTTRKESAFFENVGTPHCETDAGTGRFLRVNAALCQWLGYAAPELLSKTAMDVSAPEDVALSAAALASPAIDGKHQIQIEKRYVTKYGDVVWGLVTSDLFRHSDGNEVFLTTIIDITARKQEEMTRSMLLRELHHRVGNTMQLVDSLVRQSQHGARSIDDYAQKVRKRLSAVASAQDLLFKSGWQSASMDDIARSILEPFAAANVEIALPHILLPTQHAQTFALALHELATNSMTRGALKNGKPVSLRGTLASGDGEEVLSLVWREVCGPGALQSGKGGFGHSILSVALPRQFDGHAQSSRSKSIYEYRADLKIPKA